MATRLLVDFFIAYPLPQSLQGLAGAPLKTENRRLNTEAQRLNIQKPERANTANPWRSGNGAAELFWHVLGAKYGPSQHGVCASSYKMHSEHKLKAKLQGYAPRACGIRYPVFRSEPANIAKRRVSGWVLKKLQKGA